MLWDRVIFRLRGILGVSAWARPLTFEWRFTADHKTVLHWYAWHSINRAALAVYLICNNRHRPWTTHIAQLLISDWSWGFYPLETIESELISTECVCWETGLWFGKASMCARRSSREKTPRSPPNSGGSSATPSSWTPPATAISSTTTSRKCRGSPELWVAFYAVNTATRWHHSHNHVFGVSKSFCFFGKKYINEHLFCKKCIANILKVTFIMYNNFY